MTDGIKAGEGEYVDPNWPETATDETPGVSNDKIEQAIQEEAAREAEEE